MAVSTVENNWSRDRDVSICKFFGACQDFLTVKTQFVFVLAEIFKIETFKLRLSCVEIFIETNQDLQDLLRLFENYQDILTFWGTSCSKISTNWEILIEKNDKINLLFIKIVTNCWIYQKFQVSTDFSILSRLLGLKGGVETKLRQAIWNCQDFLDCRDLLFAIIEIETRWRKIETPKLSSNITTIFWSYRYIILNYNLDKIVKTTIKQNLKHFENQWGLFTS